MHYGMQDNPAVYSSSSNTLIIRYTTTVNNGGTGWLANYVATAGTLILSAYYVFNILYNIF